MKTSSLPWPERVAMLSINPDAASSADVAQLASDLMNCHQQDRLKTNEINILVKENNELRAALEAQLDLLVARLTIRRDELRSRLPAGPYSMAMERHMGRNYELTEVIKAINEMRYAEKDQP